jgi:hypothetical protein
MRSEWLPEDRVADRAASSARHGAANGGDRPRRGVFTFSPAHMAPGRDPHEQRNLTPISLGGHPGH